MALNTPGFRRSLLVVLLAGLVISPCWAQAPAAPAQPTIFAANVKPAALPAGTPFKLTFRWNAVPMDADYTIFVHFIAPSGAIAFQDDHMPTEGTSHWQGSINDTRTELLPDDLADGTYKIVVGIYGPAKPTGWINYPLVTGPGVEDTGNQAYQIGVVTVDHAAPPPPFDSDRPATLNLKGYHMTFDEEFKSLDVSALGPGTRWIAHTPYNGDFGDAAFANPGPDSPFSIQNGQLQIEAKKIDGKWQAGLLASVDPKGAGFSQTYGYFEMCAKFPTGPGTWPAFWLGSARSLKTSGAIVAPEMDVVEQYGQWPHMLFNTLHLWGPKGYHIAWGAKSYVADMTTDYHKYGLLWTKKEIIWYFDGVEMFRRPTPPEANSPMYVMVNLALGSGWPIDHTPDPSDMLVKYIRVYAKEASPTLGSYKAAQP